MKKPAIQLDQPSLSRLRTLHQALTPLSEFLGSADSRLATMKTDEEKFDADLKALEGASDYNDVSVVAAIHTKRGQIELLQRQVARIKEAIVPKTQEAMSLLNRLNDLLPEVVRPEQEAILTEMRAKLQPIYGNEPSTLSHYATVTPKHQSFVGFFHEPKEAYPHSVVRLCRERLPVIEKLLNGESPWAFVEA
jgi:hypothetical protein